MNSHPTIRERPPAVAGSFYPAQPQRLAAEAAGYVRAAEIPALPGRVRGVIAPHAGYIYSGPIAGYSFRALQTLPAATRTVYLLGPAHYVPVRGVAVATYQALHTPLGPVAVATEQAAALPALCPLFELCNSPHEPEHSLEVELPFLQAIWGERFRVVPLLFGPTHAAAISESLARCLQADAEAIIVVSSDLSHFHPYDRARRLDTAFLDAVIRGDRAAAAQGEACGREPILILMQIAAQLGWQPHLLDYRNSGDTAGDKMRVVGYGAVAYTA